MVDKNLFAMFFNASPRKNWNTYKMLEAAKAGAEEAGATTELVNAHSLGKRLVERALTHV